MRYKKEIDAIVRLHNYVFDAPMRNGLANVIVKVRDAVGTPLIVKYYPRDTFKMEREKQFVALEKEIFPVPHIIVTGENYIVMDYVDGESGVELFMRPQMISRPIGRKIGEKVWALHAMQPSVSSIGFLGRNFLSAKEYDLAASHYTSNTQFLRNLIQEQMMHLKKYGIALPKVDRSEIIVENDRERVLVHHDLCLKNILFKDDNIATFLDFEYAMIGSRLFDLAKVDVLGMYLAYHTGGKGRHLDFPSYRSGFYEGYGAAPSFESLRPFYIYILLNYILFWLSSPIVSDVERQKILPIHQKNLSRIVCGEQMIVPPYENLGTKN